MENKPIPMEPFPIRWVYPSRRHVRALFDLDPYREYPLREPFDMEPGKTYWCGIDEEGVAYLDRITEP